MASDGVYSVTLDEAIEAMRLTAKDMSVKYKETSLSGLAVRNYAVLTINTAYNDMNRRPSRFRSRLLLGEFLHPCGLPLSDNFCSEVNAPSRGAESQISSHGRQPLPRHGVYASLYNIA
jgi:hypothetical protein